MNYFWDLPEAFSGDVKDTKNQGELKVSPI